MAKMGRPKLENPKSTQLAVRLDQETLEQLDRCAAAFNEKRVEIIRRGIRNLFSDLKNK